MKKRVKILKEIEKILFDKYKDATDKLNRTWGGNVAEESYLRGLKEGINDSMKVVELALKKETCEHDVQVLGDN